MKNQANFLLTSLIFFLGIVASAVCQEEPSCGLVDVPTDTSQTNPYILNPVSQDTTPGVIVWEPKFYGPAVRTSAISGSDLRYMDATTVGGDTLISYRFKANVNTTYFPRIEKRRYLNRFSNVYCEGDADKKPSRKYYFKFPIQDTTPPEFLQKEYFFNISPEWNSERPISGGQFVIVGDNAYELGSDPEFTLTFTSSPDYIRIEPTKLWSEGNQEQYYYRLDLFLKKDFPLDAGNVIEVTISARDEFNTGTTKLIINVA